MAKIISTNPAKGNLIIGEIEASTESEIKAKVTQAHNALESWNEIGVKKRIEYLRKVQKAIHAKKPN